MPPPDSLFTCCKKGDIARIRYLVEKKEVELNVRDCWDSTPLYYACHCGHYDVVNFLLENGARCEPNTFDGERCLYGALTNSIRRLLLDARIVCSKRRDDFDELCEKMLKAEEFSDITMHLGDKTFKLHRCILTARSEYFSETLQNKWKKREIKTNAIDPDIFEEYVKFIYTGRLTIDRDQFEDICILSDKCKVGNLTQKLMKDKIEGFFFESTKKRVKISTLIVDTAESRNDLLADFGSLIDPGVPEEYLKNPFYRLKCFTGGEKSGIIDPIYDLCLQVDEYKFYCNKVFVCSRSAYFTVLLQDHFEECTVENGVTIVNLRNIKPAVLTCVLYYVYTNSPNAALMTTDVLLDVLEAADMYLLPGLKKQCSNFLCELVNLETVIDLLKISRIHELSKLEDHCSAFMAENITKVTKLDEFREFVISDAKDVQGRQETDSIAIIDEIRFHITSEVATFSEVEEAQAKLKTIDDMLEVLGLEA